MGQSVTGSRALRIGEDTSHMWSLIGLLITLAVLTRLACRSVSMHIFTERIACLSTMWRWNNIFSLVNSLRLYSRWRVKSFLHAHLPGHGAIRITRLMVGSRLADVRRRVGVKVDHRSRLRADLNLAIIGKVSSWFSWKRLARLAWLGSRDILLSSWRLSVMSLFNYSSRCRIISQRLGSCCWRSSLVILVSFNYMFQVRVTVWQTLAKELLTVRGISLRNVIIL